MAFAERTECNENRIICRRGALLHCAIASKRPSLGHLGPPAVTHWHYFVACAAAQDAAANERRSPTVPELPTIAEAGVPGYESAGWFGMMAPAATPREIVGQLNREVNRILQLVEVKARLLALGAEPASTTPESFLEFIRNDNAKWARLIKERGIVIERGQ